MNFFPNGYTSGAWTERYFPSNIREKERISIQCFSCTPITSTIYDELGTTFTDAAEAEVCTPFPIHS
jgi:hypothetical protein